MKRHIILILFLIGSVALACGQTLSTTNAKALKLYERAQKALLQGDASSAASLLEQAIAVEPSFVEPHLILAEWHLDARRPDKAKEHYYAAVAIDEAFHLQAWLQLGKLELDAGNYLKAKENYATFLRHETPFAQQEQEALTGIATADFRLQAMQHPVDFQLQNMGPRINSAADEYLPALTVDGQEMIFTRRTDSEDFFRTTLQQGQWSQATRLGEPINTPDNEGAQCLSQDGRLLFFTACGRADGAGRCDLYLCTRKGGQWGKPRNLGAPVNTSAWESQPSFSIDGRTLYFVSDRKGGYGGLDIWKSVFTDEGWSAPVNLGPNINTAGDEMSPFIHYDDRTLYFASNGHIGMGGQDLFVARLQDDGSWGQPTNLGYPINTPKDETNLIVSADGLTAYYSSDREGGYGRQDLYTFPLPAEARPLVTLCMKGTVSDAATGQKVSAQIQVIDLQTGEAVAATTSDGRTGAYMVSLPAATNYAIHASAKGYLFHSQNIDLAPGTTVWREIDASIALSRIESGQLIALRNVFFATGKSDLLPASQVELDKVAALLKANPTIGVELGGHTDNVGSAEDNLRLSQARAEAVMRYLVGQGIEAQRLTPKGYGESRPVADNATEEGRQQNRRTELKIL